MFGIGVPELILILIIGLVIFGPGKLPEVGKAIGRSLNEFKKATSAAPDSGAQQNASVQENAKKEPERIEAPRQGEK